jgi:polysaccharide pyruvyl transferase WcaK-like protein
MINKIMLLGATFKTNNMGVSALTVGAANSIWHTWPDVEITLLDYGKRPETYQLEIDGKKRTASLLNLRFSKNPFQANHVALLIFIALVARILPERLRNSLIGSNGTLQEIDSGDLFFSIAGGDSFSDIYGIKRFFYVSLPQVLVVLMNKRLIQLPQTYGPYKSAYSRIVSRFILNRSERIMSRDRQGAEQIRHLIGKEKTSRKYSTAYDLGFVLEPLGLPVSDPRSSLTYERPPGVRLVGMNVSGLLYRGGYTQDNMFGLKIEYKDMIDKAITYLVEEKNCMVLLVPHVFGTGNNLESDISACEEVHERHASSYPGRIFMPKGEYNQNTIKGVIGQCDLFIGARMHACIAAVSQGIPTLSIAYSGKFFGVMETVGCQSLVADARTIDFPGLKALIDRLFSEESHWRDLLSKKMPEVRESTMRLFLQCD